MKHALSYYSLCLLLAATSAVSASTRSATLAEPRALPDCGGSPLPTPVAGQRLACAGQDESGYQVICRDRHGLQRYALLPFRDAWGRVTGRAWTSNTLLTPFVVEVLVPATLVPHELVLPAGLTAEVLAQGEGEATLKWVCGGESVVFSVPQSQLLVQEPPALTDAQLLEETLETTLAERVSRNDALLEEVAQVEEHVATVSDLIRELSATTLSNAELEGRRSVAQNVADALAAMAPALDEAQRTRADQLRAKIERQAWPARQEAQLRQERLALEASRDQLIIAQAELQQLRMHATTAKAEADAAKGASMEDEATDKVIKEAAAVHLQLAKMVAAGEQGSAYTDKLLDVLGAIQAGNEELLGRLQENQTDRLRRDQELQQISAQLQLLQEALSSGQVVAAPPPASVPHAHAPAAVRTRPAAVRPRPAAAVLPRPAVEK